MNFSKDTEARVIHKWEFIWFSSKNNLNINIMTVNDLGDCSLNVCSLSQNHWIYGCGMQWLLDWFPKKLPLT